MRICLIVSTLCLICTAPVKADVIFSETWDTAPAGVIASGPLNANNSYTVFIGALTGQTAIVNLGGGDKALEHQVEGSGSGESTSTFTTTLPSQYRKNIATGEIVFQYEVVVLTETSSNNNRHLGMQLVATTGSRDGYAVRFAPRKRWVPGRGW